MNNAIDARLGWVSSPDGRGTIDIIWGCLLTIFLCVWTVLTLNVPAPDKSEWGFTLTKTRWMGIALFGPEWLTAMAGAQWSIARRSVQQFRDGDVKDWTMRQAFFADMGGVRIRLCDGEEFPVTSKHIYVLLKFELVDLRKITKKVIDDKSKADWLLKSVTIGQTVWFLLQCFARLQQDLSITTLELSTVSFVACTIGTNIMWWSKPKDVFVPIVLDIDCTLEVLLKKIRPGTPDATRDLMNWKWSPLEQEDDLRPNFLADVGGQLSSLNQAKFSQAAQKIRFRNDRLPPIERDWLLNGFLGIVSFCFGAIYVAGWNISFPTYAEHLAWRICTLTIFSLVLAFWVVDMSIAILNKSKKVSISDRQAVPPVQLVLYTFIASVYVIMRLYLLVEPFASLRSLPAVAFKTVDWTLFIPHV